MMHLSTKLLLVGAVALALAEAYPKVSPPSHDFGNVGVMGLKETDFRATHSPDTPVGTTLTYGIEGPNAADFLVSGPPCPSGTGGGPVCTVNVEFRPRSTGRRSAKLVVTDSRGNSQGVPVEGTGVLPICTHTVIPCNYAIHYSGVFSWQGGGEQVTVDVLQGVAACNGTAPEGGRIQGPGLIGVEFGPLSSFQAFYRITVACPSPAFPGRDGYPATPSEPAELGHGEQSSDKQPLVMTLQQIQERLPSLKHSISYPAGDAAAGAFTVSWDLCPNGRTIPSVGGQARCSPPGPP